MQLFRHLYFLFINSSNLTAWRWCR